MAELDEGGIFDISLDDFADVVQEQADLIEQIRTDDSPEAAWLRSMFSPEFLDEKQKETDDYIADLRKRAKEKK